MGVGAGTHQGACRRSLVEGAAPGLGPATLGPAKPHVHIGTHTHHPVNMMPTPRLSRQRRDDRSLRRVGSGTGIVNVFVELHRVRELAGSQKRQRIKTHPEGHRVDEHREVLGPCRERPCRKRRQDFDGSCPTKEPHIREHTVTIVRPRASSGWYACLMAEPRSQDLPGGKLGTELPGREMFSTASSSVLSITSSSAAPPHSSPSLSITVSVHSSCSSPFQQFPSMQPRTCRLPSRN